MPTHFSKLEESPSNRQRELRRKIRTRSAMTKGQPSLNLDESVASNATICEDGNLRRSSSYRRNRSQDIPQVIHIQNSKRLLQIRDRPLQRDDYCQSRVSAISSSTNGERETREDDGYALPTKGRGSISSFSAQRDATKIINRVPTDQQNHLVYDLTSINAPSEPSTLTNNSYSIKSHRRIHTLVNGHGVLGSTSSRSSGKQKQRNRVRNGRDAVKRHTQSLTNAFDEPFRRRRAIISYEDSNNSLNEASLMGEQFADGYSEYSDRVGGSLKQKQDSGTKWLCDVCKEARFDSYVEACRHESQCQKRQSTHVELKSTEKPKSMYHQLENVGKIYGENRRNNMEYSRSMLGEQIRSNGQELYFSSSSEASSSSYCRIATTPFATGKGSNDSVMSRVTNRWLCSVCKEVSFDNYSDACTHEKICKIQMEATSDLRTSGRYKPSSASVALPPLHNKSTSKTGVDTIQEEASIKMWREAQKLKGDKHSVSPLLLIQPNFDDDDLQDDIHENALEFRQDENGRGSLNPDDRLEIMDVIEREREGILPIDSPFGKIQESYDDKIRSTNFTVVDNAEHTVQDNVEKGEAYDRYVLLASQQEEEEERDRFIALAKQTREEEMLSYRQGDTDEDRYVCLA